MAPAPAPASSPLSGRALLASLTVLVFLAFVLPPGLALWLQRSRTARASNQIHTVAQSLDSACVEATSASVKLPEVDVLVGPGDPIESAVDARWLSDRVAPLSRCMRINASLAPDPWRRPLLVNVAAIREGHAAWLVSSGPNGIVETSFIIAAIGGDDIGVSIATRAR